MCTHYQALKDKDRFAKFFQVEPPASLGKWDMWPLYSGCFIRVPRKIDSGDEAVPAREAIEAQWGLVPHWVKTEEDAKKQAAETWCAHASNHAKTCGGKPWRYALIAHDVITENMSLAALVGSSGDAPPKVLSRNDSAFPHERS